MISKMKNINDRTDELINLIFKKLKDYKKIKIKVSKKDVDDLVSHLKKNN